MMRNHILVGALLLALAGCSDSEPTTGAANVDSTSVAGGESQQEIEPETIPAVVAEDGLTLPPGVALSTRVDERGMHDYTTKSGQKRQVVIYEFMDGDVATMSDALRRSFEAAGFSAKDDADRKDGKTRIIFLKPVYGRVNAVITTDLGDKPKNPEAPGAFSLDMPFGADTVAASTDELQ